jgi:DNA-binding beta-propeller fold protein YncE
MKRRQFTQACISSALLPLSAALVACGGGGSADTAGSAAPAGATGQASPATPALPNERVVVSSKGTVYTLNNDDKSLSQASGIAISSFASGGWQLATQADAYPVDASFDDAGKAYVLDKSLCEIRVYSPTGQWQATLAGYGSGPGQLNNPSAITVVNGRIYVADSGNHRVQVFALDGTPQLRFGALDTAGQGFNYPRDVEVGADGTIYVLQSIKSVVTVHDSQGNYLRSLDLSRNAQGKRQRVNAIALGPAGELVYTEITTGTVGTLGSQGQITSQLSAQTHYGKPVAARYIAQGRNAQPLLSGFVNLA